MSVAILHTISDLRATLGTDRPAFVPTMGALHEGHAALVRRARGAVGSEGPVVVSIFVNPTQFAPDEDFSRYPRKIDEDIAICQRSGANAIFAPSVEVMYPSGLEDVAEDFVMPSLPDVATQPRLEDAFRPAHFAGVCKVVARLFDIVQPSHAIFGEKDYQQLRVISDMVDEQPHRWPDLKVIPHPTIREPDGLAMSSRNAYLTPKTRKRALAIWRALSEAKQERTPAAAEDVMRVLLEEAGFEIDYAAVRHATALEPVQDLSRPSRALIAARIGTTRLIDNMPIDRA